jgi:aminomethyltransferase
MKTTALTEKHRELGATMVEFASFSMPIQYPEGTIKEHLWTRSQCGLFDVSHMGQLLITGEGASDFISTITPSDFSKAKPGAAKYTLMLNEYGGIIDDLIVTKFADDEFFMVINASRLAEDLAQIRAQAQKFSGVSINHLQGHALIAIQGPEAENVLQPLTSAALEGLGYMKATRTKLNDGTQVTISRLGYTGEDGFEVSVPNHMAVAFWGKLLASPLAKPIGLGARDSLRLEMGYPLYGNDISETISPKEAGLTWVISKNNQSFVGSTAYNQERVLFRKRIGLQLLDKGIARQGDKIFSPDKAEIGIVTSGGYSPVLECGIAQCYLAKETLVGDEVLVQVRKRMLKAVVKSFPMVETNVKKAGK